jgi:hypothetical protein
MKKYLAPGILYLLIILFSQPTAQAVDLGQNYAFGDIKTVGGGFSRLVRPGFAVATTIVALSFIIGAFKFMTSAGDKEDVAAARDIITHAIIGFIILIFVFLILRFIPDYFGLGFRFIE